MTTAITNPDLVFFAIMGPFIIILWTGAVMLLWTLWKYRGDLLKLIDSLPSGAPTPPKPPPIPEFTYQEHLRETRYK